MSRGESRDTLHRTVESPDTSLHPLSPNVKMAQSHIYRELRRRAAPRARRHSPRAAAPVRRPRWPNRNIPRSKFEHGAESEKERRDVVDVSRELQRTRGLAKAVFRKRLELHLVETTSRDREICEWIDHRTPPLASQIENTSARNIDAPSDLPADRSDVCFVDSWTRVISGPICWTIDHSNVLTKVRGFFHKHSRSSQSLVHQSTPNSQTPTEL